MAGLKPICFQVVEGIDKGRTFVNLDTPVTIGREEGNVIRLNDDRISRFHAKIQEDHNHLVLTDLDSTNGTRINGETVQLRLLRLGDRISLGKSTLVYGTIDQIREFVREIETEEPDPSITEGESRVGDARTDLGDSKDFDFGEEGPVDVFRQDPPALPIRLSPAQAAQMSEVIDFLHRGLADAAAGVHISPGSQEARLTLANWQRVQAVLTILSNYSRSIIEPNSPTDDF